MVSATRLPPLSLTEPQHSAETPMVTNAQNHWFGQKPTGHTEDENTNQSDEPHGRQEAGRQDSTPQGGQGRGWESRGFREETGPSAQQLAKLWAHGPYLLSRHSEANTFRPPTRSSREPGERAEGHQHPGEFVKCPRPMQDEALLEWRDSAPVTPSGATNW